MTTLAISMHEGRFQPGYDDEKQRNTPSHPKHARGVRFQSNNYTARPQVHRLDIDSPAVCDINNIFFVLSVCLCYTGGVEGVRERQKVEKNRGERED